MPFINKRRLSNMSYGEIIGRMFAELNRYNKYLENLEDPTREIQKRGYDEQKLNEKRQVIRKYAEYLYNNAEKFKKTQVFALFTKDPDLLLQFIDDNYDIYAWKEIIEKIAYARVVKDEDYYLIIKVHKMPKKYIKWIMVDIFG